MSQSQNVSVNLLNQDEFSSTAIGKVLLWALSIGRYIVVFTELIVILSFLSRFKLDRELTDLNEAIARQKAIIMSYGDLEDNIRHAQDQIEVVREQNAALPPQEVLSMLGTLLPPDIRLKQLQVNPDSLQLSAIALSPQGFAQFVNGLNQNDHISHVSLGAVSSQDEGLSIEFELTADLESDAG